MLINNAETLKWLEPPGSAGAKAFAGHAIYQWPKRVNRQNPIIEIE